MEQSASEESHHQPFTADPNVKLAFLRRRRPSAQHCFYDWTRFDHSLGEYFKSSMDSLPACL